MPPPYHHDIQPFYPYCDCIVCVSGHAAIKLGYHREVITRMLRYLQSEDVVRLSRGTVTILNKAKLENMQNA